MSLPKLRSVPDPLAGLKADLETARQHHARLESRLAAARSEVNTAGTARLALLTDAKALDDAEIERANARVLKAEAAVRGLVDATAETARRVVEIEARVAAEVERNERQAEAARLARAIETARATLAETSKAISRFCHVFEGIGIEGKMASDQVAQAASIALPAANAALVGAENLRTNILAGTAPLPPRASAPPQAAPQPPAIERVRVFVLASPLKWHEGNRVVTAHNYSQCDLPVELVARAVAHNLADDRMSGERVKSLMHRQTFSLPPPAHDPQLVDLGMLDGDTSAAKEA